MGFGRMKYRRVWMHYKRTWMHQELFDIINIEARDDASSALGNVSMITVNASYRCIYECSHKY
jgi:hypothetical protein